MRFRTSHKMVAYLVAGLGMLALGLGGVLHPAVLVIAALASVASWWAEEPLISKPTYSRSWTAVLLVILVVQIIRIVGGSSFVEGGIEFAVLLQISRLWNRRGARDYQQIVVLSLVHLIAASILDQDFSFAVLYAGFVVALPWSMTLSHLRREIEGNYRRSEPEAQRAHVNRILNSRRIISPRFLWTTAMLALPIFAMSGALFVFFPRVGLGFLAGGPRRRITVAGFSDTVQLGDVGVVRDDNTVVMRVELDPLPSPPPPRLAIHWRGAAYDRYDGRQWTRTEELDTREPLERVGDRYCLTRACGVRSNRVVYRIYLEDLDPPVLLLPPASSVVIMGPQRRGTWLVHRLLLKSRLDEVRRDDEPTLVVHYSVESPAQPERAFIATSESNLEPFLQLPPDLDPRIGRLAREVADGHSDDPLDAAQAVAEHLRSSYRYSLDLRGTSNERPLADFLFNRRSGHCEFFSTAMAIMLRTIGVPTRSVTGFLGGRLNPYGGDGAYYTLTQSDAHSWVEVYADGVGWVAFEPTPSSRRPGLDQQSFLTIFNELLDATQLAWEKNVVAYDLESQFDLFSSAYLATRRWRHAWRHRNDGEGVAVTTSRYDGVLVYLLPVAGLVILLVAWRVYRNRRRSTSNQRSRNRKPQALVQAEGLLRRLDRVLSRRDAHRPLWITPLEHALRLSAKRFNGADLVLLVIGRYNEIRFGGSAFADGELLELEDMVRQIGELSGYLTTDVSQMGTTKEPPSEEQAEGPPA